MGMFAMWVKDEAMRRAVDGVLVREMVSILLLPTVTSDQKNTKLALLSQSLLSDYCGK